MTGVAIKTIMGTIEFIVGLGVVIETPQLPAVGVVTQATVFSKTLFVNIVRFVAGITVNRGCLEGGRKMAFFTGCDGVLPYQRKLCQVMIENDPVSPVIFIMATFTFLAFLTFVSVIKSMTGIAIGTELIVKQVSFVTGLAFNIFMLAT